MLKCEWFFSYQNQYPLCRQLITSSLTRPRRTNTTQYSSTGLNKNMLFTDGVLPPPRPRRQICQIWQGRWNLSWLKFQVYYFTTLLPYYLKSVTIALSKVIERPAAHMSISSSTSSLIMPFQVFPSLDRDPHFSSSGEPSFNVKLSICFRLSLIPCLIHPQSHA